jgi:hypothetical protein
MIIPINEYAESDAFCGTVVLIFVKYFEREILQQRAVNGSRNGWRIEEGLQVHWIARMLQAYMDDVFVCVPQENALVGRST